jgi:hypothetical protein
MLKKMFVKNWMFSYKKLYLILDPTMKINMYYTALSSVKMIYLLEAKRFIQMALLKENLKAIDLLME